MTNNERLAAAIVSTLTHALPLLDGYSYSCCVPALHDEGDWHLFVADADPSAFGARLTDFYPLNDVEGFVAEVRNSSFDRISHEHTLELRNTYNKAKATRSHR